MAHSTKRCIFPMCGLKGFGFVATFALVVALVPFESLPQP
jgi:hypothetical protein